MTSRRLHVKQLTLVEASVDLVRISEPTDSSQACRFSTHDVMRASCVAGMGLPSMSREGRRSGPLIVLGDPHEPFQGLVAQFVDRPQAGVAGCLLGVVGKRRSDDSTIRGVAERTSNRPPLLSHWDDSLIVHPPMPQSCCNASLSHWSRILWVFLRQ